MDIHNTKILYSVLNWGIGHATRSIPIIQRLIDNNNQVFLASSGDALVLLQSEFPDLNFFQLPDYKVNYKFKSLFLNAFTQFPKVHSQINIENDVVRKIVSDHSIQLIISDSSFGTFHTNVKSILISHQLRLPLPNHLKFMNPLVQRIYKFYLRPFDEFWVPDFEGVQSLSGILSLPFRNSKPLNYIGIQSRFANFTNIEISRFDFDLLFILSGPEPARTVFEKLILNLISDYDGKVALVRGKPNQNSNYCRDNLYVFDYQNANQLLELILKSKKIICRSGYSSLMDLTALNRSALIVPTPGQFEQEYLADYHRNKLLFSVAKQSELSLKLILNSR